MVTSEVFPFAKTGGLADVASALSRELKRMGHDVRILMPRYYHIDRASLRKRDEALGIWLGRGEEWTAVYESELPGDGVPVYFLDHERYYGRDGIYGARPDEGFKDNAARFALLSRGAFQFCRMLHWIPDVIHCHDWPSAPACYLLKKEERWREFGKTLGVLTIHNLGYQGVFSLEDALYLQRESDRFNLSGLEFAGALNFLKAGIICADEITTVSPTYAGEICRPEYGFGLDGLLTYRRSDLTGILNGADYSDWNPETDRFLAPDNYSLDSIAGKARVKKKLQARLGLPVDSKVPLVGVVTRLVEQKGVVELFAPVQGALYSICRDMAVQFAVLGSGEKWCEDELEHLNSRLGNLAYYRGYNEELSHYIQGGSDFCLMPSRYEPCGLSQIYSLAYGSLPIARATGGLVDTVENYDQSAGRGTGFLFNDLSPHVLYQVLGWVMDTWYNRRDHIRRMRRIAMKKRFLWETSAQAYLGVYEKGLTKIKGTSPGRVRV
jgi:starch synthase